MEIFLNLWDELDDLAGACRHIATSFAIEAAALARPAATVKPEWNGGRRKNNSKTASWSALPAFQ